MSRQLNVTFSLVLAYLCLIVFSTLNLILIYLLRLLVKWLGCSEGDLKRLVGPISNNVLIHVGCILSTGVLTNRPRDFFCSFLFHIAFSKP
jgi:hypothetical protein